VDAVANGWRRDAYAPARRPRPCRRRHRTRTERSLRAPLARVFCMGKRADAVTRRASLPFARAAMLADEAGPSATRAAILCVTGNIIDAEAADSTASEPLLPAEDRVAIAGGRVPRDGEMPCFHGKHGCPPRKRHCFQAKIRSLTSERALARGARRVSHGAHRRLGLPFCSSLMGRNRAVRALYLLATAGASGPPAQTARLT
jgi:hypothetical protein